MRVKCISTYPTQEQIDKLGEGFYPNQDFHLTVGKEYLAIGIQFEIGSPKWGTGAWIQLVSDYGRLSFAPLCLFEITDGRLSQLWVTRLWEDGSVSLWPSSFYREYYHDDLSEAVPEIVDDFKKVMAMIEEESLSY